MKQNKFLLTIILWVALTWLFFGIYNYVSAGEYVNHVSAYHTNDNYNNWEYNNSVVGNGYRYNNGVAFGTYQNSYNDGMNDGQTVYANVSVATANIGSTEVSANVAATLGYPEYLHDNTGGFMLVPSISVEQNNIGITMVPGQWTGGDNAYMFSVITKD